jgi:hypothetical protein
VFYVRYELNYVYYRVMVVFEGVQKYEYKQFYLILDMGVQLVVLP